MTDDPLDLSQSGLGRIHRLHREDSIGWRTTRLLHPDDGQAAAIVYPDLVSGAIAEATLRQRFKRRDGGWSHIEVSVRRLVDADGRFLGTSGMPFDALRSATSPPKG